MTVTLFSVLLSLDRSPLLGIPKALTTSRLAVPPSWTCSKNGQNQAWPLPRHWHSLTLSKRQACPFFSWAPYSGWVNIMLGIGIGSIVTMTCQSSWHGSYVCLAGPRCSMTVLPTCEARGRSQTSHIYIKLQPVFGASSWLHSTSVIRIPRNFPQS